MKIGFIGIGNMAAALISGLLHQDAVKAQDIFVSSTSFENSQTFAQRYGVVPCRSNQDVAQQVDCLILAVKPNILPIVLPELSSSIAQQQPLIISIAAGVSMADIAKMLALPNQPIIRVMPNVNVSIEMGVSAICWNSAVSPVQQATAQTLFAAVGSVYPLAEKDFSTFIGLAGSSPAYIYMFIDAISRAGVLNGMPKQLATEIAAKAVLGSAKRLLEGSESPWELVDQVSSPGGTTVEGVVALEKNGFIAATIAGIDATIKKDQSM